jgi:hypothetical protein
MPSPRLDHPHTFFDLAALACISPQEQGGAAARHRSGASRVALSIWWPRGRPRQYLSHVGTVLGEPGRKLSWLNVRVTAGKRPPQFLEVISIEVQPEMYLADPEALPDDRFAPGELGWLVAGNDGRLLDARRTPVRVTAIDLRHGFFEIEIAAFEDKGARWLVPLEEVTRYQFSPQGERASASVIAQMTDTIARLNVALEITPGQETGRRSEQKIAAERARARDWLTAHGAPDSIDPARFIDSRRGSPQAFRWLAHYLADRQPAGLADMDDELATRYVSNPWSGDLIRAHLITTARLGLSTYRGKAIRDGASLSGKWAERRRAEHIIIRAAFTQALWERADRPRLMVYRGIGLPAQEELKPRAIPLTSATFSRAIAESHFNSERADTAALLRRRLPVERLYMTFLETPAMNKQYLEADAVLFGNDTLL